jgi:putative transposase
LYYHVWFSTRRRAEALLGENREIVLQKFQETARYAAINLIEAEAQYDHAHLLVEVRHDQTLPGVVKRLKGASAREVFDKVPELRMDMHSNNFWQRRYGWRLVPPEELEVVRHYIQTQLDRPLRHDV